MSTDDGPGIRPARICLFALTGMGNAVVRALVAARMPPALVVTRPERDAFPHYDEGQLVQELDALGIPFGFEAKGEGLAREQNFDLVLAATYHRRIDPDLRDRAPWALNIHPSLLPAYKGPVPFYWVLRDGQARTGVTVHRLEDEMDSGDIVWQRAIEIAARETQGSLRRRLAELAGTAAVEVAGMVGSGRLHPLPVAAGPGSRQSRPDIRERTLDNRLTSAEVERRVRALSPHPGALYEGRRVAGLAEQAHEGRQDGEIVQLASRDGEVRLRLIDG